MPITIADIKKRAMPIGKIRAVVQYLEENPPGGGGTAPVTTADITDASAVGRNVLKAADAAAARTAIGAGTSNLKIGTAAADALAGNTVIPAASAQGTAAQLEAGTDTTLRLFSAKMIHDEIARQIAAIPSS